MTKPSGASLDTTQKKTKGRKKNGSFYVTLDNECDDEDEPLKSSQKVKERKNASKTAMMAEELLKVRDSHFSILVHHTRQLNTVSLYL